MGGGRSERGSAGGELGHQDALGGGVLAALEGAFDDRARARLGGVRLGQLRHPCPHGDQAQTAGDKQPGQQRPVYVHATTLPHDAIIYTKKHQSAIVVSRAVANLSAGTVMDLFLPIFLMTVDFRSVMNRMVYTQSFEDDNLIKEAP